MPTRRIYTDDEATHIKDEHWLLAIEPSEPTVAEQSKRIPGSDLVGGSDNPVIFSFSGQPDDTRTISYVVLRDIEIPANPTWYSVAGDGTEPDSPSHYTIKRKKSGTWATIGTVTIGVSGEVTASPAWATETLTAGDAITCTGPAVADVSAAHIGLGFMARRTA
jgi:hypothetical protein